jgi:predicted outer membrane lipoprotein
MNRLVLGILLGVAFGVIDVVMTLFSEHPDRTRGLSMNGTVMESFP